MKVLITGGCGFIGSALGDVLAVQGNEVFLLDNMNYGGYPYFSKERNLTIIEDHLELDSMIDYVDGMDVIYHFGGISNLALCQLDPKYAYDVNVGGTLNVLEAARFRDVGRVVFSSTSAVYENTGMAPLYESDNDKPDLVYSMTKRAAEDACLSYAKNYGMDIRVLRFFNTYGPGQDHTRDNPPLIPTLCHSLFSGIPCTIYGDGEQRRDYVYIDDVVDACIRAGQPSDILRGQIINIASNTTASPNMIRKWLAQHFGMEVPVLFDKPEEMWSNRWELFEGQYPFNKSRVKRECNKFTWGAINRAKALLEWKPNVSIEDGVVRTAEAIKEKYYEIDAVGDESEQPALLSV